MPVIEGRNAIRVNIGRYGDRVVREVETLLKAEAPEYLRAAQEQRFSQQRWGDITGNARQTLNTQVGKASEVRLSYLDENGNAATETVEGGDDLTLVLAHGVYYGTYLELANDERFATVGPTFDHLAPQTAKRIKRLVEG